MADDPEETVRVNITIKPGLLKQINAHAKALGQNRSVFLSRAAEHLLDVVEARDDSPPAVSTGSLPPLANFSHPGLPPKRPNRR